MAEEVKLPQLGESVTEGTITAWLFKEGDRVEEDQPLFEISTDKIDTEVPSPATGILQKILVGVDETVEVGTLLALIGGEGEAAETSEPPTGDEASSGEGDQPPTEKGKAEAKETADEDQTYADTEGGSQAGEGEEVDEEAYEGGADDQPAAAAKDGKAASGDDDDWGDDAGPGIVRDHTGEPISVGDEGAREVDAPAPPKRGASGGGGGKQAAAKAPKQAAPDGDGGAVLSPVVRRLLSEHDLEASSIQGSGAGGRVTRQDVEQAVAAGGAKAKPAAVAAASAPAKQRPAFDGRSKTEPLTRIRKVIAKHMHESLQKTAQLTSAVEVDVTNLMAVREQAKDAFKAREGASLSPLPFIARAVCMALPSHPKLNSSIDVEAGTATYHGHVNLGIAVDTESGLIVPTIKDASDLTVPALARAIADLADRARNRKLQPDDVSGGTFTITNTGSLGVLFDTPVLNPPEVALLATPTIEKRPIVVTVPDVGDVVAIRWMTYLCLTYDHRMVDGADAARFLGDLKSLLETHDWAPEVGA